MNRVVMGWLVGVGVARMGVACGLLVIVAVPVADGVTVLVGGKGVSDGVALGDRVGVTVGPDAEITYTSPAS